MSLKQTLRLALSFSFFQFLMPIIGWWAGTRILSLVQAIDHWVAFGLLFIIGCRMIHESLKPQKEQRQKEHDRTIGWSLFLLSLATSIDALAMGLAFATLGEEILYPAVLIGVVTFLMTVLGTRLGPIIGQIAGKWAELLGGVVLALIGIKILIDHL
jgi:putative Mn2+ efflux pump MntP